MTDVEQSSARAEPSRDPDDRSDIEDTAIRPVDPRIARRPDSRTGRGGSGGSGGSRRARTRRRHTVLKVLVSTVVALALVTGLSAAYLYRHLNGNLTFESVKGQIVEKAPAKPETDGPHEPLNILVMGSDDRSCAGCGVDNEAGGGGSDTTILLHLSADRKHAYGISIPRDSMVERPDCKKKNGDLVPGSSHIIWNAAFAAGGAACTISQFQHDTGIPIDYSVTVDFGGFKGMVDAIGGVDVCIPETFYDSYTKTTFDKGTHLLKGSKALAYVRVRHNVGDGSDIGRTRRQQAFIASMISKVMSANTLANPIKVTQFLDSATKSLKLSEVASSGLDNITDLAKLALQFKHISLDKIEFITVPFVYGTGEDRGRVLWKPEADEIWKRILNDKPLGDRLTSGSIKVNQVPGQSTSSNPSSPSSSASPSGGSSQSPSSSGSPSAGSSSGSGGDTSAADKQELESVGLCA